MLQDVSQRTSYSDRSALPFAVGASSAPQKNPSTRVKRGDEDDSVTFASRHGVSRPSQDGFRKWENRHRFRIPRPVAIRRRPPGLSRLVTRVIELDIMMSTLRSSMCANHSFT